MKITKFLLLSFFFFAFITTSFPQPILAEDPEAVVDIFGNQVRAGAPYFIGVPSVDNTSTLAVSEPSMGRCPRDVILSTMDKKLPVTISPVLQSNDSVIRENTYVNLRFDVTIICRRFATTMWQVPCLPKMRECIVTTGGVDRFNRFKITKYKADDSLYQLSYCPMSEGFCECSCVPVGYVVNDGVTNLATNANPLPIVFGQFDYQAPKIEYKMVSE